MNNFGFLIEGERGWVSSSLFFHSLLQLGIKPDAYYIPVGLVLSAEEILYYTDSLIWELAKADRTGKQEHYDYVLKISEVLRDWGRKGLIIHVV